MRPEAAASRELDPILNLERGHLPPLVDRLAGDPESRRRLPYPSEVLDDVRFEHEPRIERAENNCKVRLRRQVRLAIVCAQSPHETRP